MTESQNGTKRTEKRDDGGRMGNLFGDHKRQHSHCENGRHSECEAFLETFPLVCPIHIELILSANALHIFTENK